MSTVTIGRLLESRKITSKLVKYWTPLTRTMKRFVVIEINCLENLSQNSKLEIIKVHLPDHSLCLLVDSPSCSCLSPNNQQQWFGIFLHQFPSRYPLLFTVDKKKHLQTMTFTALE